MRGILLMVFMLASQAQAGAWPREKGHAFLSFAGLYETDSRDGIPITYSTFYGEYGLTDKLTLGVDLGGDGVRSSKYVGFLRLPLGDQTRKTKIAVEFGLGLVDNRTAFRPGLSLGRGIVLAKRPGWIAVDTRAVFLDGFKDMLLETDLTFGLSATKRIKIIMQLQAGIPSDGSTYFRLAPSVVYEQKPGRHIEFGATAELNSSSSFGLKMGTWMEF